jgi:hypothetical protein
MKPNPTHLKSMVQNVRALDEQRRSIESAMADSELIGLTPSDISSMTSLCETIKEKRSNLVRAYISLTGGCVRMAA